MAVVATGSDDEHQMILQDELEIPPARRTETPWRNELRPSFDSPSALVFVAFFIVIVLLQIASGAYHSEFGGYPDEPAHYVTSLMVREYITGAHWFSPAQFAEDYYHHYPKVAIGHWPPFFYLIQALWMMVFSASRASVLLELALTTTLLGYSVYLAVRRWFNWKAGVLAGFLIICLPLVQTYTDEEMSETLLALACFWSVSYFARYLDSERWQDSLGFALLFFVAVLIKGSGWLLALVPPIALLLTRKLHLIRRWSFALSIVTVGVLCLPWQLFTMRMVDQGWAGGSSPSLGYTMSALVQFPIVTAAVIGLLPTLLALIGIVNRVLRPIAEKPVESFAAVMFSLIVADWLFHAIVPAGVEDRKLIMAVPALVLFAFAGGYWIAERLQLGGSFMRWRTSFVAVVGALCFFAQTFAIPRERHYGYTEAAHFITSDPQLHGAKILVSSQSVGEGLLISEIAMCEPHPNRVIVRATKALAQVNWNASEYKPYFSTISEVLEYLTQNRISLIVVDTLPAQNHFSHDALLKQAIEQSGSFRRITTFPNDSGSGQIEIFRFAPAFPAHRLGSAG